MSKLDRDLGLISYILGYCEEIDETLRRFGNDYSSFENDKIFRNATIMCILQIGELSGRLSDEFIVAHSAIPWRSIKAMRNIVAHAYGSISIPDVWETIERDIPVLKAYCQALLG